MRKQQCVARGRQDSPGAPNAHFGSQGHELKAGFDAASKMVPNEESESNEENTGTVLCHEQWRGTRAYLVEDTFHKKTPQYDRTLALSRFRALIGSKRRS